MGPRRLIMSAVAALLIGVVVAIIVFALRDDDAAVADSVGTTTSEPTRTTTTVAAATTSAPTSSLAPTTTIDPWEEIPILLFSGPEGEYRTGARFFAPFRVSLPDGWKRAFPELSDIVELSPTPEACEAGQGADECAGLITVYDPLVPTVDEAVAALRSRPGTSASEPEPIEIGGVTGFRLTITTPELSATLHTIRDGGVIVIRNNRRFVTHVLDVAGQPVVLILDTPIDGSFDTDAQNVVSSIVWRALE